MNIGILGSGDVAKTLAAGLVKHGHNAMLGSRDSAKLRDWAARNPKGRVGTFSDVADFGDVIILAVKGTGSVEAVRTAGAARLTGKTVIDATNPIADAPPSNGVLSFFTNLNTSLMEQLQQTYPNVHFVKAFNSVGVPCMVNPSFKGGRPSMFICGNNDAAKKTVEAILDQFGWDSEDMGKAEAARAIEPLCMLWCIPGFLRNDWAHAFKMLR